MHRAIRIAISSAMVCLMLVACGGNDNDAREKQMEEMARDHGIDADVSMDEDGEVSSVTIKGMGNSQVGTNLKLPEGFPEDVPIADDWSIIAVTPAPGGYSVSAMTDSSIEEALDAARDLLASEGWTETRAAQNNPMMVQAGFSKDQRMTNLNLIDTGDNRTIQLITMQRP